MQPILHKCFEISNERGTFNTSFLRFKIQKVGAAIRLCDGGSNCGRCRRRSLCTNSGGYQTSLPGHIKMILIINKLARLIMKLFQDIDTIFQNVTKIIEDCNVVVAEAYHYGFTNADIDIEDTGKFNYWLSNVVTVFSIWLLLFF